MDNLCRVLEFLDSSSESDDDEIIKYISSKTQKYPIPKIGNFIIDVVYSYTDKQV